jgi:predicted DNA-binding protein
VSVRLDPDTDRLLERLAGRSGKSKSAVLREAVALLAREEASPDSAFRIMKRLGLIGCVRGDGRNHSSDAGRKVREILLERKRRQGLSAR